MPDERKSGQYPSLEHMSTEELEKLLSQDFSASNDTEPDVNYIMAIMEVIQKRKAEASGKEPVDVDAAWKDFKKNYQGQANAFTTGNLQGQDSSHPIQSKDAPKYAKRHHILRYVGIAAAIIVLLCGVASAFGLNIFQAIADWTTETFDFVSDSSTEQQTEAQGIPEDDPYSKLRMAVADETSVSLVPIWAPDGTEQTDTVRVIEEINAIRISSTYLTSDGQFTVCIRIHSTMPEDYVSVYQKDDSNVQEYETGGVVYYIMKNNENCEAAWTNGNAECFIQGDLSTKDLEKMVDSILKE